MICPRCKQSPCQCLVKNYTLRLATLNVVMQPSDSEEFFLAKHILKDGFKMTVDEAIAQHEAENKEEGSAEIKKNMVNRYIDTYGQAHLFCEMHALFRTEYTFDVPGVPYDACEHCGIQNLDPDVEREPPTTPHLIDEPGWYRTKSGQRAYIEGCDSAGQEWYGSIEEWGETEVWRSNGESHDDYTPWMIVAKESVLR